MLQNYIQNTGMTAKVTLNHEIWDTFSPIRNKIWISAFNTPLSIALEAVDRVRKQEKKEQNNIMHIEKEVKPFPVLDGGIMHEEAPKEFTKNPSESV